MEPSFELSKKNNHLFWKLLVFGLVVTGGLGIMTVMTLAIWLRNDLAKPQIIKPTPLAYNQIAFIGNDDNLWLVAPDGSALRQVTSDKQAYRLPTWSPDNRQLAFIGTDTASKNVLYVSAVEQILPRPLFSETTAALMYPYFTPDSQAITFLVQTPTDLTLRQAELREANDNRILAQGAPLFWTWTPQGDKLALHLGGGAKKAQVAILENKIEATPQPLTEIKPGSFQAPLWSPDGKFIFYTVAMGKLKGTLYKMNVATAERVTVAKLKGMTFMTLSPDGQYLAYMQFQQGNQPPYGTAYIVDTNGQKQTLLTKLPVASLYWSPDGTKLALLTLGRGIEKGSQVYHLENPNSFLISESFNPNSNPKSEAVLFPQEMTSRWLVYYLKTGQLEVLKSGNLTEDFAQTIPYFDQFHHSLMFWSPDSRYFLVAEKNPTAEGQGFIWITDSTLQEEPRKLAEGTMAVWSWR